MRVYIWPLVCILISILLPVVFSQESFGLRKIYEDVRNVFFGIIGRTASPRALRRAAVANKLQTPVESNVPFPCDISLGRSPTEPRTVHEVRPGDISVVGALGDSLTAANGAVSSNVFEVFIENRGLSWSIGGQGTWRQYLTLPNILKEFNPNLVGYSRGDALSHHSDSQFNVAEIGSMGEDMYFMAKVLIKRMKADRRVNFEKDWKLVSLMVGANDFCYKFCYLSPEDFKNVAEIHRQELIRTLDYLRDNLPRTIINFVLAPNLEILHDLKGLPAYCDDLHVFTCPCLFGINRQASYPANIEKQREWQVVQREVANDERYRTKSDFAVVLQPFTAHLEFPIFQTKNGNVTDPSLLAADCFHFSQKGYARAANALWNNMLEPIGNKSENWPSLFTRFLCPTKEQPFIFTHGNSFTNQIIR